MAYEHPGDGMTLGGQRHQPGRLSQPGVCHSASIGSSHQFFEIEESIRGEEQHWIQLSHHGKRDSIESYLTVVFAASLSADGSSPAPADRSEVRLHRASLPHSRDPDQQHVIIAHRPPFDNLRQALETIQRAS